jgi:transposase
MEVLYSQCAGLDVHKDTVVACVRRVHARKVWQEVRTFATTTTGLLALSDWLTTQEVTHVAMEATGVYWKPVWHVLEGDFDLVLANAAHIRNVPGRKTDVNDAMWIADLLAHGLIRASFVPPVSIQELRDLTRTRKQLVREAAQHTLRIQKTLEDANLKITGVITDLNGVSGRAILQALVDGQTDPERLADLARGRLKRKRADLIEALRGRVTPHHRTLLTLHLQLMTAVRTAIATVDAAIGQALEPIQAQVALLLTIPGVSDVVAQVLVAEIGVDMGRFATAGHLISWAGLCPRQDESAGKRRSTRVRKGAPWLKTTLVTAAWASIRVKGSYLRAQFLRIKSRRGSKKAILAVAASMLTAVYHMLRDGVPYQDLGADHFEHHDRDKIAKRLISRLKDLGLQVEVHAAA